MDESTTALCHYSSSSDRRSVTFREAPSSPSLSGGNRCNFLDEERQPVAVEYRNRCYHWIFKMMSSRFCVLVLVVKLFLLGVILPVHLQHLDYNNQPEYGTDDAILHGYPNPNDAEVDNHAPTEQSHSEHTSNNGHAEDSTGNGHTDNASSPTEPSHSSSETTSDDGIDVVRHVDEPPSTTEPSTHDDGDKKDSLNAKAEAQKTDGLSAPSSHSSCSSPSMEQLLDKIDLLAAAVQNIDQSIDKMETLMQSTVVDERVYKCIAAITTGNHTLALKYWNQILPYQATPSKKQSVLAQLIKESYSGKEDNVYNVIKFIQDTEQYYGYSILHKEMVNYNQVFNQRGIFTLAYYAKKNCGKNSKIFQSLPSAAQSVFSDYFTLQSKVNKGYLYYAKRCVARHYYYCLDVLTKRIAIDELKASEAEEKRRYHWKLNATDSTASKFFILNQDKYWSYRLQDLNNSPRFKMEEAGSIFEIEWAHFQLKLHTEDEIVVQVRDTNIFLEGEEIKFDNTTEVLLHSFYKTEQTQESDRIYWLVKPVTGIEHNGNSEVDEVEHDNCKVETNGGSDRR